MRSIYEFAGFRLDTRARTLMTLADGSSCVLKPKLFDMLSYFLDHPGELLEKDRLLQALWPRQIVDENNLMQYVSALRRLLGGQGFIMTVRARGYRFIPEVLRLEAPVHNGRARLASQPASPAWQCYRQAAHLQNSDQPGLLVAALPVLQHAIALDPELAEAHALLALTRIRLCLLDHPAGQDAAVTAFDAAQKARELAPMAAGSHAALGAAQALRGEWLGAELSFQTARDLDPDAVLPRHLHGALVLLSTGQLWRALDDGRQVMADVQGLSSMVIQHACTALVCNEDAEAHKALALAQAMGADLQQAPALTVQSLLAQRCGDLRTAEAVWRRRLPAGFVAAGGELALAQLHAALADPLLTGVAVRRLDTCLARRDSRELPLAFCKQLLLWLVQLRALDSAFALLDALLQGLQARGRGGLPWDILWLAELRPLREDPRFNTIVVRLGLSGYWQVFGSPDAGRWVDGRLLPHAAFSGVRQRSGGAVSALQ